MLYHLCLYLQEHYKFLNVFRYITFRSFAAFFLTFAIVLIVQPLFIKLLKKIGMRGQPIRNDGPQAHQVKSGTPTMGGLVVVGAVVFSTLLLADLKNIYIWVVLLVTVGLGALGFLDDWLKITKQNSYKGVSEKGKLLIQALVALIAGGLLYWHGFSTQLTFPFFKHLVLNLGIFFILFEILVVISTANAVNLTDGLDGLAIGPIMTVAVTYCLLAYLSGNHNLSDYLNISYVAGAGELCIILAAVLAGGLGFLWYNSFPAQIFMGDTGALALGGLLGISAVIVKQEILLIMAGGIFVVEALSVLIQRYYYKMTGKRVFRMAPIHHHFELKGWAEPKIIVRFWIISIVLALLCLTTLKLR